MDQIDNPCAVIFLGSRRIKSILWLKLADLGWFKLSKKPSDLKMKNIWKENENYRIKLSHYTDPETQICQLQSKFWVVKLRYARHIYHSNSLSHSEISAKISTKHFSVSKEIDDVCFTLQTSGPKNNKNIWIKKKCPSPNFCKWCLVNCMRSKIVTPLTWRLNRYMGGEPEAASRVNDLCPGPTEESQECYIMRMIYLTFVWFFINWGWNSKGILLLVSWSSNFLSVFIHI